MKITFSYQEHGQSPCGFLGPFTWWGRWGRWWPPSQVTMPLAWLPGDTGNKTKRWARAGTANPLESTAWARLRFHEQTVRHAKPGPEREKRISGRKRDYTQGACDHNNQKINAGSSMLCGQASASLLFSVPAPATVPGFPNPRGSAHQGSGCGLHFHVKSCRPEDRWQGQEHFPHTQSAFGKFHCFALSKSYNVVTGDQKIILTGISLLINAPFPINPFVIFSVASEISGWQ